MPWSDWQDGFAYTGTAEMGAFRQLAGPDDVNPPSEWFSWSPIPTAQPPGSPSNFTAFAQTALDQILTLRLREAFSYSSDGGITLRQIFDPYVVLGATEHIGSYQAGLPTIDPPGLASAPHGVNPATGTAFEYEHAAPSAAHWDPTPVFNRYWDGVGRTNDRPVETSVHVDFDLLLLDHLPDVGDPVTSGTVLASISFDATPTNTPAFQVNIAYPSLTLPTTSPTVVLAEAPRFLRTGVVTSALADNGGAFAQSVRWAGDSAFSSLTFSATSPRWRYWIPGLTGGPYWGVRAA